MLCTGQGIRKALKIIQISMKVVERIKETLTLQVVVCIEKE